MTFLGKALVLFNLAFGLLLAAWSFAMYANRVDWSNKKGTGNERGGEFYVRAERIRELEKALGPAQARWRAAGAALRDEETRRAADRTWSENEMKHLLVTASAEKDPVGEVVFTAKDDDKTGLRKGQLQLDDKGEPLLVGVKDLAGNSYSSLDTYNDKDAKTLQDLDAVLKKHTAQIEQANQYTDLITGVKDADGKVVTRGLYQRIQDEKAKRAGVQAEQALLKPLLVNTVVEGELILKRRTELQRRIAELKKFGVASGQ